MNIVIDLFELKNICMGMSKLGACEAMKAYSPSSDELKKNEARRWLTSMGYDAALLDKMVDDGLVSRPYRKGKATNSPLFFSKLEIMSALNAMNMSRIINK